MLPSLVNTEIEKPPGCIFEDKGIKWCPKGEVAAQSSYWDDEQWRSGSDDESPQFAVRPHPWRNEKVDVLFASLDSKTVKKPKQKKYN